MVTTIPDIPRIYTAIAEWSACLIFISIFKLRFEKGKTTLISIYYFPPINIIIVTITPNVIKIEPNKTKIDTFPYVFKRSSSNSLFPRKEYL